MMNVDGGDGDDDGGECSFRPIVNRHPLSALLFSIVMQE